MILDTPEDRVWLELWNEGISYGLDAPSAGDYAYRTLKTLRGRQMVLAATVERALENHDLPQWTGRLLRWIVRNAR